MGQGCVARGSVGVSSSCWHQRPGRRRNREGGGVGERREEDGIRDGEADEQSQV